MSLYFFWCKEVKNDRKLKRRWYRSCLNVNHKENWAENSPLPNTGSGLLGVDKHPFTRERRCLSIKNDDIHCRVVFERFLYCAWGALGERDSSCAGPRNRPKSGCCGPAEATYKLFSRQWRKKKVTSGSFPLSCGLSWHSATIFLIKLSSWRMYLFVRRPVTSFLVSFWLKSSNLEYDGIAVQHFGCVHRETENYTTKSEILER